MMESTTRYTQTTQDGPYLVLEPSLETKRVNSVLFEEHRIVGYDFQHFTVQNQTRTLLIELFN
jgi:hypothetical protein